jgi:hypothetical protein
LQKLAQLKSLYEQKVRAILVRTMADVKDKQARHGTFEKWTTKRITFASQGDYTLDAIAIGLMVLGNPLLSTTSGGNGVVDCGCECQVRTLVNLSAHFSLLNYV